MTRTTTLLIIGLLISVLINGVLAGAMLQRASAGPDARPGPQSVMGGPRGGFRPGAFLQALPADVRSEARARMRDGAQELRPLARAAMRARLDAEQAVLAEPFDSDAAAEALAQARAARAALEAHGERVVLDIVDDLTPAERREALRAAWGGGARRGPVRERLRERFGREEG